MAHRWEKKKRMTDPTKLHKAKNEKKVLDYLSREGVELEATDDNGDTPLHAYVRSKNTECLFAFLINAEYDINILNESKDTPLHVACKVKHLDSVKALLAFDADFNIFNKDKLTPLDIARSGDCTEMVQLLMDIGGLSNLDVLNAQKLNIVDMDYSLGGVAGFRHGRGEWDDSRQNALASDGQGVREGEDEQSKRASEAGRHYPKEKMQMDYIPEDGEEESTALDEGRVTSQLVKETGKISPKAATPLIAIEDSDNVKTEATGKTVEKHGVKASGSQDFLERLAGSMCSGLEKLDYKAKESIESFLKDVLQEEDYKEWQKYKVEARKNPQSVDLEHHKPQEIEATTPKEHKKAEVQMLQEGQKKHREATDYLEARSKTTTTPGHPPVALRRPEPPERRHTDAASRPRPQKHVRFSTPGIGESLRLRSYRGVEVLQKSLKENRSVYNPRMSVVESELGTSVMPGKIKELKEGQRGHRILCLDGGGVKGVIELEMLRAIERMSGFAIPELFDWIVGTSIGGIFSLGMVYGKKNPNDLLKLCFRLKNDVFSKKTLFKYSFDSNALEKILKDMFKETHMKEIKTPKVMITAVRKDNTSLPLIFFNNCFGDYYSNMPVWEVARSTSAAPVYFKSHDNLFLDGGLVANNPCNHGLTKIKIFLREIKEKQAKRGSKMTVATDIACVVSLGCGDFPPKELGNMDIEGLDFKNILHARERIMNVIQTFKGLIGRSEDDAKICQIFCEEMQIPFYRFNPPVSEEVGTTETDNLKISDLIISAKKLVFKEEAHLEALVKHLGKEPVQHTRIPVVVM